MRPTDGIGSKHSCRMKIAAPSKWERLRLLSDLKAPLKLADLQGFPEGHHWIL